MQQQDSFQTDEVSDGQVTQYLQDHPTFLDNYLMEYVEIEMLERWMIRRSKRDKQQQQANGGLDQNLSNSKIVRKTSLSRWKFCVHADKRKMLVELTASLQSNPSKQHALWELSQCVSSAINADKCSLYLMADPLTIELYRDTGKNSETDRKWKSRIGPDGYLCAWVASCRKTIRISGPNNDENFPKRCPFDQQSLDELYHVLCMPIVQSSGQLEGVMEFYRTAQGDPFYEEDEEIVNSYLVWGAIALHYSDLYKNMRQQKTLNDFMLSVVKSIFQDMVSMDNLIMKVMNFAQTLVSADRASLFLLDSRSKCLFARIFDMGVNADGDEEQSKATEEIRFPVGTGIAGIVAQNGEVLNIPDAYADDRFNRSVDQLTGYVTKSILCMPIYIRGNVIGVMQMVNKTAGAFTKDDEESFEMFAVYCGLALHHAKLYDKIRRSEQKYKVALEVLSYHNSSTEEEVAELVSMKYSNTSREEVSLDEFHFSSLTVNDLDKVRHTIFMFVDLFGLSRFEKESLIRFTLTIKKNYRRVPYHNWSHGFSVCNAMYTIIKNNPTTFKPLECLSLFVAALCHDLDHRGKNNKFMLETESPLAAIYTTSTLERHHFNQTITILQQDGHNIFSKLTSSEYKQVLSNIKHCILATDLALFFPTKAKLTKLLEDELFEWSNFEHRLLVEAITMTACDLCASTKPWEVQVETVKVIFEEFYEQGDAEKAAGKTPMPMMDREKVSEQPMSQVGFLKGICIPCYELLLKLVPVSGPMLSGCEKNYSRWKKIADDAIELAEKLEAMEKEEKENAEKKVNSEKQSEDESSDKEEEEEIGQEQED
uniref:Phosphodiesterase n=1 Tax=Hirondellea gigas TaxID=1518452 RepID=A0A6A7G776_9CRUS